MTRIYCFEPDDLTQKHFNGYLFIGSSTKIIKEFGFGGRIIPLPESTLKTVAPRYISPANNFSKTVQFTAVKEMLENDEEVDLPGWEIFDVVTLAYFFSMRLSRSIGFKESANVKSCYCITTGGHKSWA